MFLDSFVKGIRSFNPNAQVLTVVNLKDDFSDILDIYRIFHTEHSPNHHWVTKDGSNDDYLVTAIDLISNLDIAILPGT